MWTAEKRVDGTRERYTGKYPESNLIQLASIQGNANAAVAIALTSSPVQNIGHFPHGFSLASPSQVLRYGLRTMSGSTGGVKVEAYKPASATVHSAASKANCRIAGSKV